MADQKSTPAGNLNPPADTSQNGSAKRETHAQLMSRFRSPELPKEPKALYGWVMGELLRANMDYWVLTTLIKELCAQLETRIGPLDGRVTRPDKRLIAQARAHAHDLGERSEAVVELLAPLFKL